jgi:hypothetical protein
MVHGGGLCMAILLRLPSVLQLLSALLLPPRRRTKGLIKVVVSVKPTDFA